MTPLFFESSKNALLHGLSKLEEEKPPDYLCYAADDWETLEALSSLARSKGSYKTLIYYSEKNNTWEMIIKRK